jgi:outer membrane murein-binding lipoprotein Lpp
MATNFDSQDNRRKPRKNKWSYVMPDLPGWNSLAAVTRYHQWAEIIGIVILGFLVLAEGISYRYGQRKDDLTTRQQETTDKRHDEEMARLHADTEASKTETAKALAQAAEANRIAEEERLARVKIEARLASRKLSPEQVSDLASAIKDLKLPVKAIKITRLGDSEAHEYATSIMVAINNAGLYPAVTDIGTLSPPMYGIFVTPHLKPAFDKAGIPVDGLLPSPEGLDPFPEILVGLKQPPF